MIADRLRALLADWSSDNGDRPANSYQRGYMAACVKHARELEQIIAEDDRLRGAPPPPAPGVPAMTDAELADEIERLTERWCAAVKHETYLAGMDLCRFINGHLPAILAALRAERPTSDMQIATDATTVANRPEAAAGAVELRAQLGRVVDWIDELIDGGGLEHAQEIKEDCLAALAQGQTGDSIAGETIDAGAAIKEALRAAEAGGDSFDDWDRIEPVAPTPARRRPAMMPARMA